MKMLQRNATHITCANYKDWKVKHSVEASILKEEAQSKGKSLYIAILKDVIIHRKIVHGREGIKSLEPPK